jgi:hypothetical protein
MWRPVELFPMGWVAEHERTNLHNDIEGNRTG